MNVNSSLFTRDKLGLLAALMIGVFLSPINVNFTSVALPSMREYFAVNVEQVSWVGTAYFIPTVVLMPLLAALGKRWGLRRMYISGFVLLAVGSFSAAKAQDIGWLLASRVLQGIGWSGLYPLALILIREYFPVRQQGEVMGLWESAAGFAAVVGPIIGGVLVTNLGWTAVYYGLSILAGLGAVIGLMNIPEDNIAEEFSAFDWRGAIGLTFSILLCLLAVTQKSLWGFLLGLVALWGWGRAACRADAPFVHPGILKNKRFLAASGAANLRMVIGISCVMSLPLFLEGVQKLSPIAVGILLPTYSLFLFLGARPGGRWADRAGGRKPGFLGFILMSVGVGLLVFVNAETSMIFIGIAMAIRGAGAGVSQSPFAKVATTALGENKIELASGLYGMFRYSGLALGSALVGILLNNRLSYYGSNGKDLAAVPAFQELYIVLFVLGLVGLYLAWMIGNDKVDKVIEETISVMPTEVVNG